MRNKKIKQLVVMAILCALIVVLQLMSAIIPPVAGFPLSFVLIPIIVGAALYGVKSGMVLGGVFGLIVFINCVNGMDIGGNMVFNANPLLCFAVVMIKGIAAGAAAGFVYHHLKIHNPYIRILLAAIVCPVVNTGIFIACMLAFFIDVLGEWAAGGDIIGYVLSGLVLANFVPELLINIVFSIPGQRIIKTIK